MRDTSADVRSERLQAITGRPQREERRVACVPLVRRNADVFAARPVAFATSFRLAVQHVLPLPAITAHLVDYLVQMGGRSNRI
jgi:hypothetical protein